MQIKKLRALVKLGESDTLEFKETTGRLSDAMRSICAFLNQEGGIVLFGVTDKGKIVGQEISDKTKREIAHAIEKIEPHAEVKVEHVSLGNDKHVIALIAKEGKNKPYAYDDRPYIRRQSTTQKMSRDGYAQLIQENPRLSPSWDSQTTNNCTLNDLDKKRIYEVVGAAVEEGRMSTTAVASRMTVKEILKKYGLMVGEKLTNAAVLLFCKKEEKQFIQSTVKMARFKGTDKSEFLDNISIQGNLFDLYEAAIKFFRGYLPIGGRFEVGNPFRIDTPAIPYKVLREALVNALCHRDYSMRSGSMYIAFYDDRVEIVSAGKLPPGITVSALSKKHESYPRNGLIAKVFFSCGMIEQWGSGTYDMIQLCKKSGNPIPIFEETTGSFSVTLPLKEPIARINFERTPHAQLTARQKEIVEILKQGPMSREQIMGKMEKLLNVRTIQKDLSRLKKLGLIVQEGLGVGRTIIWTLKRTETN